MLGEAFDWVEALAFAVGLGTSIHPDELLPIPATALSLSRKKLPDECDPNHKEKCGFRTTFGVAGASFIPGALHNSLRHRVVIE